MNCRILRVFAVVYCSAAAAAVHASPIKAAKTKGQHSSLRAGRRATQLSDYRILQQQRQWQPHQQQGDLSFCHKECPSGDGGCGGVCGKCIIDPNDGFPYCSDPSGISHKASNPYPQQQQQQPIVTNIALHGTASQSSTCFTGDAKRAVDGNTNPDFTQGSVTHTCGDTPGKDWWKVDLGGDYRVQSVKLYNRNMEQNRLSHFYVDVLDANRKQVHSWHQVDPVGASKTFAIQDNGGSVVGRFVQVRMETTDGVLSLAEVEVMGYSNDKHYANQNSFAANNNNYNNNNNGPVYQTQCPRNLHCGTNGLGDGFCHQFGCGGGCINQVCGEGSQHQQGKPSKTSAFDANHPLTNLALHKTATQSTTCFGANAGLAVDGNQNGDFFAGSVSHTCSGNDHQEWWMVDLGSTNYVQRVKLYNRDSYQDRLSSFYIDLLDENKDHVHSVHVVAPVADTRAFSFDGAEGRFVRVRMDRPTAELALAEVEVMGYRV